MNSTIPPASDQDEFRTYRSAYWLLRVPLAVLFLFSGLTKLFDLGGGQAEMAAFGLPGSTLYPVIAFQICGSIALLTGFLIRWAAFGLAAFVLAASALAHPPMAVGALDIRQATTFIEHLVIIGALLFVAFDKRTAGVRRP